MGVRLPQRAELWRRLRGIVTVDCSFTPRDEKTAPAGRLGQAVSKANGSYVRKWKSVACTAPLIVMVSSCASKPECTSH